MTRLNLIKLAACETGRLYKRMKRDFPASERAPRAAVRYCISRGIYDAFYLMESARVLGYAVTAPSRRTGFALLSYFAVEPDARGGGFGGRFLRMLMDFYSGMDIILEVEDPDFARDSRERDTRLRRIAFYEREGLKTLDAKYSLFGVDMLIMRSGARPVGDLAGLMRELYRRSLILSPLLRNVRVTKYSAG